MVDAGREQVGVLAAIDFTSLTLAEGEAFPLAHVRALRSV